MAPRSKRQELRIQHSWHISRRRHAPFARGPLRPKASGRPTPTCSTSSRRTMRRRGDCGAPLALATWHDTCAPCPLAAGCGTPCAGCAFHVALRHIGGALIGLSTHATPPESQWQHGAGALRGCGGDSGKAGSVCGMGDLRGAVDGVRQRRGQHGRIMTKRLCHLLWGLQEPSSTTRSPPWPLPRRRRLQPRSLANAWEWAATRRPPVCEADTPKDPPKGTREIIE